MRTVLPALTLACFFLTMTDAELQRDLNPEYDLTYQGIRQCPCARQTAYKDATECRSLVCSTQECGGDFKCRSEAELDDQACFSCASVILVVVSAHSPIRLRPFTP